MKSRWSAETEFRSEISVNFGRFFLNFEFSKRNFPKIPKHFFPVPSGNEKFRRNSAKFRRNFKPWMRLPQTDKHDFNLLVLTSGASLKGVFFRISRTLWIYDKLWLCRIYPLISFKSTTSLNFPSVPSRTLEKIVCYCIVIYQIVWIRDLTISKIS